MIKICFVCLGNICRSPMAEYMLKDKLQKRGLQDKVYVTSRATSYEEEGNDIYPPAKRMLTSKGINYEKHKSKRLEKSDYNEFDYFIGMENSNIRGMMMIFEGDPLKKVRLLMDYDIKDPWYTNNFDITFNDLDEVLNRLVEDLIKKF